MEIYCYNLLCNSAFVIRTHHDSRLVQVFEEGNFLWNDNMHHIALLVETHAFNREEEFGVQLTQSCCLTEYVIYDLVLNHLKGYHSCDKREGWLILLVQRLNFEEGAEWVLLLAFVELFVETKLFLLLENTVGEVERLSAVLRVCD